MRSFFCVPEGFHPKKRREPGQRGPFSGVIVRIPIHITGIQVSDRAIKDIASKRVRKTRPLRNRSKGKESLGSVNSGPSTLYNEIIIKYEKTHAHQRDT